MIGNGDHNLSGTTFCQFHFHSNIWDQIGFLQKEGLNGCILLWTYFLGGKVQLWNNLLYCHDCTASYVRGATRIFDVVFSNASLGAKLCPFWSSIFPKYPTKITFSLQFLIFNLFYNPYLLGYLTQRCHCREQNKRNCPTNSAPQLANFSRGVVERI